MKNVIIIKTTGLSLVAAVENFSKENVIAAIASTMSTDVSNVEQLSASCGSGIYGVREATPSVIPYATNPVSDAGFASTLEVEYGIFSE